MFIALTGTPGTGKTSVSNILKKEDYKVLNLNEIAIKNNLITGIDKKRNSKILDVKRLNDYISKTYSSEELIFIEGHASHFLNIVEKVIVLRCHPKKLKKRLEKKGWNKEKIKENVEAEALDIILCETVEFFSEKNVFEIDTTRLSVDDVVSSIDEIIDNEFRFIEKYKVGSIDWSEEVFNWI